MFRLKFLKTIVIFIIRTIEFVKNEISANRVNFSIGSAFSKGPGFSFSEGPGLGQGPLDNV